jgi:uncharacterized protein (TIGR02594 family)
MSTALALSFAACSLNTSASAAPEKKEPKQGRAAQVVSAKKAAAVKAAPTAKAAPAMQAATVKSARSISSSKAKAAAKYTAAAGRTKQSRATPVRRVRLASINAEAQIIPAYRDLRSDSIESAPAMASRSSSTPAKMHVPHLFASSDPVTEARRWIGTNPTDRSSLWCARFMNFVLERSGYSGTGSDAAKSFASYGRRISGPRIGAIAVMTRGKNGGHVGIVSGIDPSGNPIVISGNHGHKVGEGVYPRSRIVAYVMPQ